ncbi:MAG TPA: hypothetical protein PK971_10055 [Saprospiraceae bacterium]|nr:hypothetical protein [Saprospiraceae bacterium]HND88664.1 hypothetical protein [Saprospiraceae bacterium]
MKTTAALSALCILLTALTVFQFCVKPPDYPIEPVIEFKSLSKTQMWQLTAPQPEDFVTVTFTYTDGDGDLGAKENPEESGVFYLDQRDLNSLTPYRLPFVEPQGTGNGISGEITVRLPRTCCIQKRPNGSTLTCNDVLVPRDTVSYIVYIRDRAGHESNRIVTPPITLLCY